MTIHLPPHTTDISLGMLDDRRQAHELRRLILIGNLLAHSIRECADPALETTCDSDREALADAWSRQLDIARPHLLRAETPEAKR